MFSFFSFALVIKLLFQSSAAGLLAAPYQEASILYDNRKMYSISLFATLLFQSSAAGSLAAPHQEASILCD